MIPSYCITDEKRSAVAESAIRYLSSPDRWERDNCYLTFNVEEDVTPTHSGALTLRLDENVRNAFGELESHPEMFLPKINDCKVCLIGTYIRACFIHGVEQWQFTNEILPILNSVVTEYVQESQGFESSIAGRTTAFNDCAASWEDIQAVLERVKDILDAV